MLAKKVLPVLLLGSCMALREPIHSQNTGCHLLDTSDQVDLTLTLTPDTHGFIGESKECRGRLFGMDMSASDFNDPANAELSRRAIVSANTDHVPIEVRAKGRFVKRSQATILMVRKIRLADK